MIARECPQRTLNTASSTSKASRELSPSGVCLQHARYQSCCRAVVLRQVYLIPGTQTCRVAHQHISTTVVRLLAVFGTSVRLLLCSIFPLCTASVRADSSYYRDASSVVTQYKMLQGGLLMQCHTYRGTYHTPHHTTLIPVQCIGTARALSQV